MYNSSLAMLYSWQDLNKAIKNCFLSEGLLKLPE
jgi:hypothetical protein